MSEEQPHARTVCVLGFGRSGTSLTTQVLKTLGVELGREEDMLPPHEGDNARGYWEPRWMVDLNDEILAMLGTTGFRPFPGEDGWHEAPLLAPLRDRARALYAEKLGGVPLAGWKDPRTTLTLPFWQQIVSDPLYVVCLRNPIDAIASNQRRPEPTLSTHEWGELWLDYTARAFSGTAGTRRLVVFYEDYFRDPRAQVERLASLLDLPPDDARVTQATALIEGDLNHHRSSSLDVAVASGISSPARLLYLALRAAQELRQLPSPDAEALRTCEAIERVALDAWRASRAISAGRQSAQELTALRERQVEQEQAWRDLEQELRASLEQAHAELDRHRHDLASLQRSLSWRVTTPLRALKRHAMRLRSARR